MSEQAPKVSVSARWRRLVRLAWRVLLLLVSKLMRAFYVLLTTLLVLLLWLLFTTSGAQWLLSLAMEEESRLVVEVRGGSVWNGLEVAGLQWTDAGLEVSVAQAELRWDPLCLLQLRACLDLLHADGIRATVDTAAMAAAAPPGVEEDAGAGELFPLPITAAFPDIRLRDLDLRVDGQQVSWTELTLSGALGRESLRLAAVDMQGLAVTLADQPGNGAAAEPDPATQATEGLPDIAAMLDPASRSAIDLPEISLPLAVYLQDLRLRDTTITRGDEVQRIRRLALSADMVGSDLTVRRFELDHTQLTAALDGSLRLAGDYPLDIHLQAGIRDVLEGQTLRLEADLWNSVADMELRVRADGPGQLSLDGSAKPLQPDLPMDITATWSNLGWPPAARTLVASDQGELRLVGNLSGFSLDAGLDLEGAEIPAGRWTLAAGGDYTGMRVDRLQGDVLDGRLLLAGTLGWVDGLQWDLQLDADGVDASLLADAAPRGIHGRLSASGQLQGDALTLDLDIAGVRAQLQGQALTVSGQVSHTPGRGWVIPGLRLETGDSHVLVSGTVDQRLDLDGSLELRALSRFLPDLQGAVSGTFSARGALQSPDIELALRGSDLAWQNQLALGSVELEASIVDLAKAGSRLRLALSGLSLPDREIEVDAIRLAADGSRGDHQLTLDVTGAPAEVSLAVAGALDQRLGWEGVVQRAQIAGAGIAWQLQDSLPARWNPDTRQAELDEHCWTNRTARLCATEQLLLGARGEAAISLQGYELAWLSPWLPEQMQLLGRVAADVTAQWGETALPLISARMQVDEGGSVVLATDDVDQEQDTLELNYDTLALALELDERQLQTRLDFASSGLGRAQFDMSAAVSPDGALGALDGAVELEDLQLSVVQPFFPQLRTLEGVISAQGTLSGAARDPRFDGSLLLADGQVETLALPVALDDIRLELAIAGDEATLAGGFRSGAGEAELSGQADWSDSADWRASLQLSGERLELAYGSIATLQASPDLELRLRPREVALGGRIVIPRADININELPESAVRTSGDVVIVDEQVEEEASAGLVPTEELPTAPGWSVSTDIDIVLGERVELTGFGVTGRLTGELNISQEDDAPPQALGEIRIVDGEYRAYGQRLRIREGQFLFSGPVDQPEIYVEAVRGVPRYDTVAGLRVEGRPVQPRVSLFSEPSLPDEEVLAFLILGRPLGESGPEGGNLVAQAALSLGILGGGGIAGSIAEGLGIEDFALETEGDGGETQFVLSGYLGPNLYLSYGVGVFVPEDTLTIRYELANNLYLEAVRGVESALDLFYTFEF